VTARPVLDCFKTATHPEKEIIIFYTQTVRIPVGFNETAEDDISATAKEGKLIFHLKSTRLSPANRL